MFFLKEQKRTERSFEKNVKEWTERNVLLKRTDAQPWLYLYSIYIYIYSDLCNELDPMQNTLYTFIFNNNIYILLF